MFPVASVRLETYGAPVDGEVADKDINSYNGAPSRPYDERSTT
jgi:hypothetical protein